MKSRTLTFITAIALFTALAIPVRLAAQADRDHNQYRFVTLDVPNVHDTFLYSLNRHAVVGEGLNADGATGPGALFVDGKFSPYDAHGSSFTSLDAISDRGEIVGLYSDPSGIVIGFILVEGQELDFKATPQSLLTQPGGVNDRGEVAGLYTEDPNFQLIHGFTLIRGVITPFDFPGNEVTVTQAFNINNRGQIAGWYKDAIGSHGYVREGEDYRSVDYPGAYLTRAFGINDHGEIVGYFQMAKGQAATGFILTREGFVTLAMPGAVWTVPQGINNQGRIAGYYLGSDGSFHGFVATPD
jgi:hypothetical protein